MDYKVIHEEDVLRGTWSGGTTAQYYICPEGAVMQDGDFSFAVSSATVDLQESTFTYYGGFDRVILSLSEEYTLIHEENEVHQLQPFEPHAFTGEEKTVSKGVYKDFNLIMRRDRCCGDMTSLRLVPGSGFYGPQGRAAGRHHIWMLFCCSGAFALNGDFDVDTVKAGEMLVLDGMPGEKTWWCGNIGEEDCRIVLCRVELF